MKVIIDIPKDFRTDAMTKFQSFFVRVKTEIERQLNFGNALFCGSWEMEEAEMFEKCFSDSVILPDNATNGDMIKAMFGMHALFTISDETFEKCVNANDGMTGLIGKTHLSKEEKELFINWGQGLGLSDVRTQENAMDNFLNELDLNIEALEKIVPNKVKLYNSMGIMLGIVIAIIMI